MFVLQNGQRRESKWFTKDLYFHARDAGTAHKKDIIWTLIWCYGYRDALNILAQSLQVHGRESPYLWNHVHLEPSLTWFSHCYLFILNKQNTIIISYLLLSDCLYTWPIKKHYLYVLSLLRHEKHRRTRIQSYWALHWHTCMLSKKIVKDSFNNNNK